MIVTFDPLRAGFYALTTAALVAVIFIDWELYIIPDELNATLLVFGVAYHAFAKSLPIALSGALLGWGLLWGIALLGRVLFRKDAMGHGDIKMMRGVGALLGPGLLVANMAIAVVAGLVIGIALLLIASRMQSKAAETTDEEEYVPPETIGSLFIHGAWYVLGLDIVGIFVPKIYSLIGESPSEELIEDDNWKPSLTTIPFGPYLAIGAVVCMLFASPIEKATGDYWKTLTRTAANIEPAKQGFDGMGTKRLNWVIKRGEFDWNQTTSAFLASGIGNKMPFQAVRQREASGVQDRC